MYMMRYWLCVFHRTAALLGFQSAKIECTGWAIIMNPVICATLSIKDPYNESKLSNTAGTVGTPRHIIFVVVDRCSHRL